MEEQKQRARKAGKFNDAKGQQEESLAPARLAVLATLKDNDVALEAALRHQ